MENRELNVPEYLNELFQPTPSSAAKLLAAWDGLSTESQIQLLSKLNEVRFPGYLSDKIKINALNSENAYVRYLAARSLYFSDECSEERKSLKEKIESDPVPLVRFSSFEDGADFSAILNPEFEDADIFFALPHEARLAKIRTVSGSGKRIAKLLTQAVENHLKSGKVSEIELYEILSDYLVKPEFHERYANEELSYDGWGEYSKGQDVEGLWGLVSKLPERISHILIENLPEESGLSGIPGNALNEMTDRQLETLLFRRDITLHYLRKDLFWSSEEDRHGVRQAAISSNFHLDDEEFLKILEKPASERSPLLRDLASTASDLRLCIYSAIHDALFASDQGRDFEDAIYARDKLQTRLDKLAGSQRDRELIELRLYQLASDAVPWDKKKKGYMPSGELEFLAEKVVPENTWKTFMAFWDIWQRKSPSDKRFDRLLSQSESFFNPEEGSPDQPMDAMQASVAGLREELKVLKEKLNKNNSYAFVVIGLLVVLVVMQF